MVSRGLAGQKLWVRYEELISVFNGLRAGLTRTLRTSLDVSLNLCHCPLGWKFTVDGSGNRYAAGWGVRVGVGVPVAVGVPVRVGVGVAVDSGCVVCVAVGVGVPVAVGVPVRVGVPVAVGV